MRRQYTCYFPANDSTNPDFFYPKTFPIPRGISPKNFSSLGFAVSEELGKKQIGRLTHSLTSYCFYRVIYDIDYIFRRTLHLMNDIYPALINNCVLYNVPKSINCHTNKQDKILQVLKAGLIIFSS